MSFKKFIYYCALCGGFAALLTWQLCVSAGLITRLDAAPAVASTVLRAGLIGGLLGLLIAGAIGSLDALLNAKGFQRTLRFLVCMLVGGVGGFLGGLLGQLLRAAGIPSFVGWVLAGTAIGASLGVFDLLRAAAGGRSLGPAVRKTINGMIGGFLGGLLGGIPISLLETEGLRPVLERLPLSSFAAGLVLLGLCIGLLIGLAQVVLMEAWLKVEAGFRPGRELLLSKDETTIGRAESCDIGLFGDGGVEKLHARILRRDNRYVLADAGTPGGTFLNDEPVEKPAPLRSGDVIRLGKCVLRFGERQKRKR